MTTVIRWLEHPVAETLGWSLLHFVWQGALIAMIVAILMAAMRRSTPERKYLVLCGGLALMSACPLMTFSWLSRSIEPPQAPAVATASPAPPAPLPIADQPRLEPTGTEGSSDFLTVAPEQEPLPRAEVPSQSVRLDVPLRHRWRDAVGPFLPWFVGGWLMGVLALSLRLLADWRKVQRMRHGTTPAPALWQECLSRLAARLRVRMPVKLVESALVEVPTVIGWLKPMILLPAAALTGLAPDQLEGLLAHELAHIRRHDYLINLLQTAIETLLFYHPAVWWLSRRIRDERELCCDDLAVTVCGDGMLYARALATMEELRSAPALALAADGGSLLARIRRIAGGSSPVPDRPRAALTLSGFAAVSLAAGCLAVALTAALASRSAAALQAEESLKSAAAADFDNDANPADADSATDGKLKALIEAIRQQEARFRNYSATIRISHEFQKPSTPTASSGGFSVVDRPGDPYLSNATGVSRQNLNGGKFQFVGELITKMSSGKEDRFTQTSVCDGTKTLAIYEGDCAAIYSGRAEPASLMPPHTWGMFHLAVSFPMSVYLSGTEALALHPKVGRHPQERGSIHEFYRVEAEIVGEETIGGLSCTIVLIKRWY